MTALTARVPLPVLRLAATLTSVGILLVSMIVLATSAWAEPTAPTPPTAPGTPDAGNAAGINLTIGGDPGSGLSNGLTTVVLLGVISLVPAILIMVTAFTRIVIVLGLTRTALGATMIPPTQVIVGLALILTIFVMAPTFSEMNETALQPWLAGTLPVGDAFTAAMEPLRQFMFAQVGEKDLALMQRLSGAPDPATPADVATTTLIPAFVLSELRTAFLIGFVIFIPFVLIDLIVSAVLTSVGMVMLPPSLISLPFKILIFIVADGWFLIVESLVGSFNR